MLLIILLSLFSFSVLGEDIVINPMTPCYRTADISQRPAGLIQNTMKAEIQQKTCVRYPSPPLEKRIEMVQLKPSGVWIAPKYTIKVSSSKRVQYIREVPVYLLYSAVLLCFAGFFFGGFYFFTKRLPKTIWFPILSIIAVHCGIVLYMTNSVPDVFITPLDEIGYFEAAKGLADFDFSNVWHYTIGWPLIMAPLIRITKAQTYHDIGILYECLNSYIIMSAVLIFAWLILRYISKSGKKAWFAVMTFQIIQIFYHFKDFWSKTPADWTTNICTSWFGLPELTQSYNLYTKYIWLGFNGLSDTWSTMLIFLIIFLLLKKKPVFLIAMLYGFSCLVRLNNIFFAPLFLFIWAVSNQWELKQKFFFLRSVITVIFGFFLVFSLQLIVNKIHFGSFLTFPYILHDPNVYKGFMPIWFMSGMTFLLKANWIYYAAGLSAILCMKDRRIRTLFVLWIIPVTLFFFGYPQAGNNGIRFILSVYAALCGAVLFIPKMNIKIILLLLTGALLTAPQSFFYPSIKPWDMPHDLWLGLSTLTPLLTFGTVILLRYKKQDFYFPLVFGLLFFCGYPPVIGLVMIGLLIRSGYDVYVLFRTNSNMI